MCTRGFAQARPCLRQRVFLGWWYAAVTLPVTADITTADLRDFPPKCVLRWEWSVFDVRHVPWLSPVSQINRTSSSVYRAVTRFTPSGKALGW